MKVTYEWCKGAKFSEIMKLTEMYADIMIARCVSGISAVRDLYCHEKLNKLRAVYAFGCRFEGSIIRAMRRLEELLRQLCSAANSIGNTELEAKFMTGIERIKRDIVFSASLYL